MGLCLELAYPITSGSGPGSDDESRDASGDSAPFRHRLPLNAFIDSILRTVYHHASAPAPPTTTTTPDGHGVRRQIIFTSSSPDACAAVNWKQPNCQSPHLLSFFFFFFSNSSSPPWHPFPSSRDNERNLLITDRLFFFFVKHYHPPIHHRPSLILVIMWRSARQASEHYGGDTQRSDVVRFAFDEHQRGGRVFKEQQFARCLFGHLPLGMSFSFFL